MLKDTFCYKVIQQRRSLKESLMINLIHSILILGSSSIPHWTMPLVSLNIRWLDRIGIFKILPGSVTNIKVVSLIKKDNKKNYAKMTILTFVTVMPIKDRAPSLIQSITATMETNVLHQRIIYISVLAIIFY